MLKEKCKYKDVAVPTMKHLEQHPKRQELETEWFNMLNHQLPLLPFLESLWQELADLFAWLQGHGIKDIKNFIPLHEENIDLSWSPSSMIQTWHMAVPLELVRYAGANHLCVELVCDDSKQLVEPYDLKRTQEGHLLLIAIKHTTGEWQSYRVDKIQGIEITQQPFIPRYIISLTPYVSFS